MNPLPLTPTQLVELSVLVASNRLRAVAADLGKAQLFLDQSLDAMTELSNIKTNKVRHDTAYNAAHDVGEALLAAYGYRTASGPGQHTAVGEFLEIIFAGGPAQSAAGDFDSLRDGRNGVRYQARPIGKAQADFAGVTAQKLLDEAQVILK